MAFDIRPASRQDVEQLAALEFQTYGADGYPSALFYQALVQWPDGFFVATRGQQVCGYVLATPGTDHTLWVMSLLIAESARGQGIGRQLMQYLLDQLRAKPTNYTQIALTVAPDNQHALRLYQQLGFQQRESIPNFMGPQHDRLLLIATIQ
ncbi:Ribosomal protein S18 acetylase RimI [Pseudidiomarina indica]|uniref:Ribosomal protein S18 acetylase RimI n=1 Tax=Pseudidiomarina indica TaxID=1159017 RepID=A0A1G6AP28_9GAMM|nr:N-acetyltransferase [Pseudidiomarina indica]SDB10168.1 Ribosomal protein S18 acetylase RimI [Pseudidiomarina indica]